MKVEDIEVFGFRKAILGIRQSYKSLDKSDSHFEIGYMGIGDKDKALMLALVKEGKPSRKFLRMIHVQMDITAPLSWWKQFDTYKIGTTANSESTMHTITARNLTVDDFETHDFDSEMKGDMDLAIYLCNKYRGLYVTTKDRKYWDMLITLLPCGYLQKRTVDLNYEVLLDMYHWRKDHKLVEWHYFCDQIWKLPYMDAILKATGDLNDETEH